MIFILEVYGFDACWNTFGVFSDDRELEFAKIEVIAAYEKKFDIQLDDSDFNVIEVQLNQYMWKEVGL